MPKKSKEITIRSSAAEYLTYIAATGDNPQTIEMRYEDENIWLTQKMMAALYDVSVAAINQHIKNIFDDHELEPDSVIKKYLITAADDKNYDTNHYNVIQDKLFESDYDRFVASLNKLEEKSMAKKKKRANG